MGVSERFNGANAIDSGRLSPYWGEHVARYIFALPFVEGKVVLDIACGTGYGIGFLQEQAERVIGVDVDFDAALGAVSECAENSGVILADGLSLPFADASFDVITSFETLEHVQDRETFLFELSRILNAEGVLVLSTPNANYTQPVNGKPSNPFHLFEYTPDELKSDLEKYFRIVQHWGQELNIGNAIPPFFDAQKRLSGDLLTQTKLLAWKVMNKLPLGIREYMSQALWKRPFYPTEVDYAFTPEALQGAPVQVVVCRKR